MLFRKSLASPWPGSRSRWPSTAPPRLVRRQVKEYTSPWPSASWSAITAARWTWSLRYAKSAAADPCSSSVVVSLKKLLVCPPLSSDAPGSPASLQVIAVLAGLSGAGMKTSLVRQGVLVGGVNLPLPAAVAVGVSRAAPHAAKGPVMAAPPQTACKLPPFKAATLG